MRSSKLKKYLKTRGYLPMFYFCRHATECVEYVSDAWRIVAIGRSRRYLLRGTCPIADRGIRFRLDVEEICTNWLDLRAVMLARGVAVGVLIDGKQIAVLMPYTDTKPSPAERYCDMLHQLEISG